MLEKSLTPPDPERPLKVCPNCGTYLYEGDKQYVFYDRGYRKVVACENCIEDFVELVEDDA